MSLILELCYFSVKTSTLTASCMLMIFITSLLYLWLRGYRRFHNPRSRQRRKVSCIWTRRRVYWLQKRVSRSEYVELLLTSMKATKCFHTGKGHSNSDTVPRSCSKMGKFGSCSGRVENTKAKGCITTVRSKGMKFTSPRCRTTKPSEKSRSTRNTPLPFIVHRKSVKKNIEFRRRSGNSGNQCFAGLQQEVFEKNRKMEL